MLAVVAMVCLAGAVAYAQDPVKVDPKHYKVVFENDKVRILDAKYGPKEKSVMHEHPAVVAIFLTDGQIMFTFPDGKMEHQTMKAGESRAMAAGKHLPENMGDKATEVIVVEMKGMTAPPPPPPAKKTPPKK